MKVEPQIESRDIEEIEEYALVVETAKMAGDVGRLFEDGRDLSLQDIRTLIWIYWDFQEQRKRYRNKCRSEGTSEIVEWAIRQAKRCEAQAAVFVTKWANTDPISQWALSQKGVGPITAAALRAYVDFHSELTGHRRLQTASQLWMFCGLRPGQRRQRGKKVDFCQTLKRVCHNLGETFKRNHKRAGCYYGQVYIQRKGYEVAKNEQGHYSDQADAIAEQWRKAKKTSSASYKDYYSKGRLPPGHIDKRACRYAVKLFLAHWFDVAYEIETGNKPPAPYPIEHMGHAHLVVPV